MLKGKFFILFAIISLLLIVGCNLDDGSGMQSNRVDDDSDSAHSRALPSSKYVCVQGEVITFHAVSSADFNAKMAAICQGAYSRNYNDGCYSGTIKSANANVISQPVPVGAGWIVTVRITYCGTVTLFNPCCQYPATKTVTVADPTIVTVDAACPTFQAILDGIRNGSRSYSYQDTCYKGTIKSIKYTMVNPPVLYAQCYYRCTLRITYSGTVYRK